MNIMFCCYGHGTEVADLDREEHGDYKKVAYVRDSGVVEYRENLPVDAKIKIEEYAAKVKAGFLEDWQKKATARKYMLILDSLLTDEFLKVIDNKELSKEDVIEKYFDYYCTVV